LPGKMAMELYPGLPALGAVIERLGACRYLDGIVVATTDSKDDDTLIDIADRFNALHFRGSEGDVLGRVIEAGRMVKADTLVLVTGDCSCISPSLIDEGIEFFGDNKYDLITNCLKSGYPVGIDLQVVKFSSLEKSYKIALREPYKSDINNFEHTNFFMKSHPDKFSIYNYQVPKNYQLPHLQLTLDTKEDLGVLKNIYKRLYPQNKLFDIDDILSLLKKEPEIMKPLKKLKVNRLGY